MSTTSVIDLSRLPLPPVAQELAHAQIRDEMLADYTADMQADNPEFTSPLPSDPAYTLISRFAYRELHLRQRINEAARAVLLAYAQGGDLDNLGALFGVVRLVLEPADNEATPPKPAVLESDAALRTRILLAVDGISVAGPASAYAFHALSADSLVKDVSVDAPKFAKADHIDPTVEAQLPADVICIRVVDDIGLVDPVPGDVALTVLSHNNDGAPDQATLDNVETGVDAEDVRPLTDNPRVRGAEISTYRIEAELTLYDGAGQSEVLAAAQASVEQYSAEHHRLGHDITVSGLYAALHKPGVQNVNLIEPAATIVRNDRQAAYADEIVITVVGVDV